MAFQTGTAATLDDLLQAFIAFAVAEAGFTEITKIPIAGHQSDMYILQKGSMYWWFLGDETPLTNYGGYGWVDFRMMTTQPTASNRTTTALGQQSESSASLWNRPNGPYTAYYLYSDGISVHLVTETTSDVFSHMSVGILTKNGTWTGGEFTSSMYLVSSAWSPTTMTWSYAANNVAIPFDHGTNTSLSGGVGYVYHPRDSLGDQRDFAATTRTVTNNQRARGVSLHTLNPSVPSNDDDSLANRFLRACPNTFNSRTALVPTYYMLYDRVSTRYVLAGHIDGARILNMELVDPKETVDVEWDVFPFVQKFGDPATAPVSGNLGVAYRRT